MSAAYGHSTSLTIPLTDLKESNTLDSSSAVPPGHKRDFSGSSLGTTASFEKDEFVADQDEATSDHDAHDSRPATQPHSPAGGHSRRSSQFFPATPAELTPQASPSYHARRLQEAADSPVTPEGKDTPDSLHTPKHRASVASLGSLASIGSARRYNRMVEDRMYWVRQAADSGARRSSTSSVATAIHVRSESRGADSDAGKELFFSGYSTPQPPSRKLAASHGRSKSESDVPLSDSLKLTL